MVTRDHSGAAVPPPGWVDPRPPSRPADRWRRALPLLLWLACLTLAVGLLVALGDGRLAAPALTDPGSWRGWAAGRDPLEITMVVLRLLALGCAWYLTGVTGISVVARVLRAVRLVRLADALSVGPIKHLVQQAVGISLAAGVLATAVPGPMATPRAAAGDRASDVAVMSVVADDEAPPTADTTDEGAVDDTDVPDDGPTAAPQAPVMVPVPPLQASTTAASPSPTPSPTPPVAPPAEPSPTPSAVPSAAPDSGRSAEPPVITSPSASPAPAVAPPAVASSTDEAPGPREVRVRSGDHFWSLAEDAVAEHLGRPGSEAEVLAHWEAVLAANADRLVAPGNPDLLVPGQLVVLPPVGEVAR